MVAQLALLLVLLLVKMKIHPSLLIIIYFLYAVTIVESSTPTSSIANNRLQISLDKAWKFYKLPILTCTTSAFTIDILVEIVIHIIHTHKYAHMCVGV